MQVVVSYWNSTSNHNLLCRLSCSCSLYLIEILHQTTTPECLWLLGQQLYLIEILHQTTTVHLFRVFALLLYLIEILHQTTTLSRSSPTRRGCILLKFYIKPQLTARDTDHFFVVSYWNSTSNHNLRHLDYRAAVLYLIEILHQTTTRWLVPMIRTTLYLIEILHQTTTNSVRISLQLCCILLKFYIKPQRNGHFLWPPPVVSYWNSTSNHNDTVNSTLTRWLYLIEILHQTTTVREPM